MFSTITRIRYVANSSNKKNNGFYYYAILKNQYKL